MTEINTAIGFKEFIQSLTEVPDLDVGLCSVRLLQSPLFRDILNTFYNRGGCREEVMLISISGQCVKGIDNEYSDAIYMWEERTLRLLIILLKYSISDTKPEQFIFFWAIQAGFLSVMGEGCDSLGHRQEWLQSSFTAQHEQPGWLGASTTCIAFCLWDCYRQPQNSILFQSWESDI